MKAAVRTNLMSLLTGLVMPVMILSPNLLWTGFSVADGLGGGSTGVVRAYLLAALLPVVHDLGAALVRRERSFLARSGLGMSLLSGALAFWFVDGLAYAFKAAVPFLLQGLLFLGGALSGVPLLIRPLLVQRLVDSVPAAERSALAQALQHPRMLRAYRTGEAMVGASKLLLGGVRMIVAYAVVTAAFGTAAFNAQVALVWAGMYLPALLFGALAMVPATLLLNRTAQSLYGADVNLLQQAGVEGLARKLTPAT